MARRSYQREEIDFTTGECVETFDSRLSYALGRSQALLNPYTGSKKKLNSWIVSSLRDEGVEYETVLDLFAGSHVFSIVMKLMGKRVFCNDILTSSSMYGAAFIQNNTVCLTDGEKSYLTHHKADRPIKFWDSDEWLHHFTINELNKLANFKANIEKVFSHSPSSRALAYANLLLYLTNRCVVGGKLNKGQVLAEVKHRINHGRNKGVELTFGRMPWIDFNDDASRDDNMYFCDDAINLLSRITKVDLAYIDPPYGGSQSDYSNIYRFFEGLCIKKGTPGIIGEERFIKAKGYESQFRQLISACVKIPVLAISYNDDSWAGIETITSICEELGRDIKVFERKEEYSYRDKSKKTGIEYLIVARKR